MLTIGSRGSDVTRLQRELAAKGFDPGTADGVFGQRTRRAVEAYQRAEGLSADGVVGGNTGGALFRSKDLKYWDGQSDFEPAAGARGDDRMNLDRVSKKEAATAPTDSRLKLIAEADLRAGQRGYCVKAVRSNLQRLGLGGLPASTGEDPNNPRGMMVQMLQSGQWRSANIPGAQAQTITSPYGEVSANVLSRDAFHKAAEAGLIPDGAVVFQTKHGWDYSGGSSGNDVGIVQDGRLFNFRQMQGLDAYGASSDDFVVVLPK